MNESKKSDPTSDVLVADALLKMQALQNLLVRKGIISNEEFAEEVNSVSRTILKSLLEKANVKGDLDKLIDDLNSINKKKSTDN
jgi:hypothetical protein